jgi:hypothetical protein
MSSHNRRTTTVSITFHPALDESDITGYQITCWEEDHQHDTVYATYDEASLAYLDLVAADHATLGDCLIVIVWADGLGDQELNLANRNACDLLEVLGLTDDDDDEFPWCGSIEADDLLGRILIADAIAPDPELPSYTIVGQGGGVNVDLGRPAGYLHTKLNLLAELARWCKDHGREVVWN